MLISEMLILHKVAKKASTGTQIICPVCGKIYLKDVHQKIFCSAAHVRVYYNNFKIRRQ